MPRRLSIINLNKGYLKYLGVYMKTLFFLSFHRLIDVYCILGGYLSLYEERISFS